MSTGYEWIVEHYGDQKAKRSGVPLINHINEGLKILDRLDAHPDVKEAFAIHPLIQSDDDLRNNYMKLINGFPRLPIRSNVMGLAMEYRSVANNFLSDQITTGPNAWGREETYPLKPVRLSPLPGVNLMLIADKVQNRKDFIAYHQASHDRSHELTYYFDLWLRALGVSEDRYQELIEDL